jgi:enoyl-CoA hydratase/carnithine racemase
VTIEVTYPADGVGLIAFSDPPKNFGTGELGRRIVEAMGELEEARCRVFVLASDTPGYFIAHWSLREIVQGQAAPNPPAEDALRTRNPGVFEAVAGHPMISIAVNNGQAWGGGAELSWACDLRVAAESATYGQPEVPLGIIPGAGGTTRLAHLIGPARCLEMILDGRPISAQRALEMGAVNRVVPDDRARDEAIEWATHIAGWPGAALNAAKRSFWEGQNLLLSDARRNESNIFRNVAGRDDALATMNAAQAKYDAGADSWEAIGLPR